MYNAAYNQHVEELTALLYNYEKDKKKLTKKVKCIVKEAYYMSRKGTEAPFVPATPAEWMSLFYQDKATSKRYIKNREVVYYPEKLSGNFVLYLNFILTILFFYNESDFYKLTFSADNSDLAKMLKLADTNISSRGVMSKSNFTHEKIKKIFGETVDFKTMFEKVWKSVTDDTTLIDNIKGQTGIYVLGKLGNNVTAINKRLSVSGTLTGKGDQFLFIHAVVTAANNTLLLSAFESYENNIYSLESVIFWEDNTASKPDDYKILTFDEEFNNASADGKFYLQLKSGQRALTELQVKDLKIRNAYYFYVKDDETNSGLKITDANFNGVTEDANGADLYTKSIAMNKLSKTADAGKTLKARISQAANAPMGIRKFVNQAFNWVWSWKE